MFPFEHKLNSYQRKGWFIPGEGGGGAREKILSYIRASRVCTAQQAISCLSVSWTEYTNHSLSLVEGYIQLIPDYSWSSLGLRLRSPFCFLTAKLRKKRILPWVFTWTGRLRNTPRFTNVSKIRWLCWAISSLEFNKSLLNVATFN